MTNLVLDVTIFLEGKIIEEVNKYKYMNIYEIPLKKLRYFLKLWFKAHLNYLSNIQRCNYFHS